MDHARVLDEITRWAAEEQNVRLAVLTGSLAGDDGRADELSDLDVELYVRDPVLFLGEREWYRRFGTVLVVEELENPGWRPTRLVYYAGGKIDFMIGPVEAAGKGVGYSRPYRVLLDKDGLAEHLHPAPDPRATPPSPEEFERCINWFYAAALMCAKSLARDEPWMAKIRDWDMKTELLQMIEWDARSRQSWDLDTGHAGARMREWMDPEIVAALGACWADLSSKRMAAALFASVALFDTLARRTALALGFELFDARPVKQEVGRIMERAR